MTPPPDIFFLENFPNDSEQADVLRGSSGCSERRRGTRQGAVHATAAAFVRRTPGQENPVMDGSAAPAKNGREGGKNEIKSIFEHNFLNKHLHSADAAGGGGGLTFPAGGI